MATVLPSLLRKADDPNYQRERISTPDEDFLDLDWINNGNDKLIIISHGLEGSSQRTYVKAFAGLAAESGYDVLAWNCRSCSGEINLKPRFYHHGDSDDLAVVIDHVINKGSYSNCYMVGYSMGGSITARYLGSGQHIIPAEIRGAVAISTPFDLGGSAARLDGPGMGFYRNRFLKKLGKKVALKARIWPDLFDPDSYSGIKTFRQFDNAYTAPLHNFKDADDFYIQASAGQHLEGINLPFLIMNAQDDPFLTPGCFPVALATSMKNLFLDMPAKGGHVGFMTQWKGPVWSDVKALSFFDQLT